MKKKIGETHFYCGFCNKLYSKEELGINGRHMNYELNMRKIGREFVDSINCQLKCSDGSGNKVIEHYPGCPFYRPIGVRGSTNNEVKR